MKEYQESFSQIEGNFKSFTDYGNIQSIEVGRKEKLGS